MKSQTNYYKEINMGGYEQNRKKEIQKISKSK